MLNKSVFPLLAALLLTACASGPRIGTMQAPDVNFSDYETFAFVDPLGTDRAGYASLISRQLIFSIRRELEMLGFEFVEDPAQADMLVNAHTHLDEKIRAREVADPLMGPTYWDYRYGFYTAWPSYSTRTEVTQYSVGTLTVDLIDAAERVMIWEGTARNEITEETRRDAAQAIDRAVAKLFEQFP
ncbi:MAG: DUF4136 domain-containing protein [Pseudomonadota bacterium]